MKQFSMRLLVILGVLFGITSVVRADVVGNSFASYEVDRFGAFNYRLLIDFPPGPGGLTPDISILYNSQINTGLIGYGWQIEGLSMIHRCAAIPFLHGERGQIDFSDDDQLCLDNHYLELINDNEYRTRIESFTKLTKDNSGLRPGFEARTKSAKIIRYGEKEDAWIGDAQQQKIFSWLMSSIDDLYGNRIQFEYSGSPEERHIYRIKYGSHSIVFEYEERLNKLVGYLKGIRLPMTKRLNTLSIYTDDTLVREYLFTYQDAEKPGPDKLISISECSGEGLCLRPTRFDWHPETEFNLNQYAEIDQIVGNDSRRYLIADFNGDGRSDVYMSGAFRNSEDTVYIGEHGGYFTEMPGADIRLYRENDLSNLHIADFDGDGLMDIYQFRYKTAKDIIYLSRWRNGHLSFDTVEGIDSGRAGSPQVGNTCVHIACLKFGDFNGDGITDIYQVRHQYASVTADVVHLSHGDGSYTQFSGIESYGDLQGKKISETELARLQIADFDGDSVSDIYQVNYSKYGMDKIYLSRGKGEYEAVNGIYTDIPSGKKAAEYIRRIKFGEFNGDGLTDIYYIKSAYENAADEIYISKGNGEYLHRKGLNFYMRGTKPKNSLERIKLLDLNTDGLSDIYHVGHSGAIDIVWFSSHHGVFHQATAITDIERKNSAEDIARTSFSDFDGDGKIDVYHINHNAKKGIQIFRNQLGPTLISQITNGLGLHTVIAYKPASEAVKPLNSQYAYPESSAVLPLWLTTSVSLNKETAEQFRYFDMRSNSAGLGFLGFSRIDRLDVPHQVLERQLYQLEYPYLGKLSESIKGVADDGEIDQVFLRQKMEYRTKDLNNGKTKFPYLFSTTESYFDLEGEKISDTVTEYDQYDDYGNVGFARVTKSGNGEVFEHIVRNQFEPDSSQWLLPYLSRRVEINSDSAGNAVVRTTEFEYVQDKLSLAKEITEPGNQLSYTREYVYDLFGNRIRETIVPADSNFSSRVQAYQYDKQGVYPVAIINPQGNRETRIFDPRFRKPTVLTDANHLSVQRQYDAWGRLLKETRPDGTNISVLYTYSLMDDAPDNSVYMVETQHSGQPLRRAYYDRMQRIVREVIIGFDGRRIFQDNVYDGLLNEVSAMTMPYYEDETSEKLVWTKKDYDALGRVTNEATPLPGRQVLFGIQYSGNSEVRTNTFGQEQSLSRDVLGRVVQIDDPMYARMAFEYDPLGRLTKTTDANGAEIIMEYDVFGNRTLINDINRGTRYFSYDTFGQLIKSVDSMGRERRFDYDNVGRLIKREDPEGAAEWEYDTAEYGMGQLARESFQGHAKNFYYDEYGRLTQIYDERGYRVDNHYDQHGRMVKIDYPKGFSLQKVYNEHGYLSALQGFVSPPEDSGAVSYVDYSDKADEYDMRADFYRQMAEGQRAYLNVRLTDAAQKLNSGAEELRQIAWQQEDGIADWQNCLQMSRSKTKEAEVLLNDTRAVSYVYQMPYKLLTQQFLDEADFYLRCAESPVQEVSHTKGEQIDFWRVVGRDSTGSIIEEVNGNGLQTKREYNLNHFPITITTKNEDRQALRHLEYFYDELGNIVDRHDYISGADEYFEYDELNRLVSATLIGKELDDGQQFMAYDYDANNNLIFKSDVGSYQYAEEGKAYMADKVGSRVYRYDDAGHLIEGPDYAIDWNAAGNVEKIYADKAWVGYEYDPNEARVVKQLSGDRQIHYVGDLFEESIAGGVSEFCNKIYAERRLIAVYCEQGNDSQLYYLHYDVLGSIDTISDDNGQLLAHFDYYPFGKRRTAEGQAVLQRGFTGHEHIDFTGLIHMNGRLYDPQLARFLSPDPYIPAPLATQSYNNYSYVMNNPLRYTDPSGFFFKKILKKIGRIFKKVASYIRRNIRVIAAAAIGYYVGNWAAANFIKSASSQLVWSPAAMANGSYISAYQQITATGNIVGGAVSGGTASLLSGGDIKSVLAHSIGGGVFQASALRYKGKWSPGRVIENATISGVTSMAAGGSFKNAALAGLQGGTLRYAAIMMRKMMIAQSMLNPDNAGGTSVGFLDDQFKLGGSRDNIYGSNQGIFGGSQGGTGQLFGMTYAPGSWQDYVVEAFAGPHDFLNSWYWYDRNGNSKVGFSPLRKWIGEGLNGANVILSAPFVAASVAPDYFYSLPH